MALPRPLLTSSTTAIYGQRSGVARKSIGPYFSYLLFDIILSPDRAVQRISGDGLLPA